VDIIAMKRKSLTLIIVILVCILPIIVQYNNVFAESEDTAWVRRYDGPVNASDVAWAIAVDGSGNVYVTGGSVLSDSSSSYATIKYYPNGDTAWVRRYNGPGNNYNYAFAIAVDYSGNVYVTGSSYGIGTSCDYATIKYQPNGDTAWVRRYNGPGNSYDEARAIAVDGSGNVYVTGRSDWSDTSSSYATIKYYPNGDTAWVRRYNGLAFAIAVDGYGNVYVTGESAGRDYATIKYYPNGDTSWVRRYKGPGNSDIGAAFAITVDVSGNVYVTGGIQGSSADDDYATIKYYPNGDTAWTRRYNGPGDYTDQAWAIAVDDSGYVYVTGSSYGIGTFFDYATIRYYPNGNTAWVSRYNGPGNNTDQPLAIAVDGSGNIYVTGYSYGEGNNQYYATIKYYVNGDTAWVKRYNGLGNNYNEASAIVVDDSGNVYVTGVSEGNGTDWDYATIKYKNVPVYSIMGKVMDDGSMPVKDSLVFLVGDRIAVDITDSNGDYIFSGLPAGDYRVFRDSLISMYIIHLTSDTSGFNFRGYSDINDIASQQSNPLSFSLSQNYPNPFNPSTKINFSLVKSGFVTLFIYDTLGRKVRTLISEQQTPGQKSVTWDGKNDGGKDVASGVYFYQLKVGDFSEPKKMLLLK
jgi:hypothetical protein